MADINEDVKVYMALDDEIAKSSKLLGDLRKKRKATGDNILSWLQKNEKVRITTKKGILERQVAARKVTVNAAYVQECAASFLNDEERAAVLTNLIFENRPTEEKEVLKRAKGEPAAPPPEATVDF